MVELISRDFNGKVIHFITCSDKECKHNLEGKCRHILPELIRQKEPSPYGGCWSPIICRSFEKKTKEEIKMSDVKITYKPVDKNKQVFDAIASAFRLVKINDFGSSSVESLAKKIDSIYNAKEEDREIDEIRIDKGTSAFSVNNSSYQDTPIVLSLDADYRISKVIHIGVTKQEARELGQALIKMSEQG